MNLLKTLLIALLFILVSCAQDKAIITPKWIQGTWNNSYESNVYRSEHWTFFNDGISVTKGIPFDNPTIRDFNKLYSNYEHTINTSDSIFKITFSKKNELIVYEFKLINLDFSDEPHISYSIKTKNKTKKEHLNSVNCLLKKM